MNGILGLCLGKKKKTAGESPHCIPTHPQPPPPPRNRRGTQSLVSEFNGYKEEGCEQGGGHWWREGGPSHLPSSSSSSKPGSVHCCEWQGLRLASPSVDGPTADASGPPAPGCRPSSACRGVASTLQAARWIGQREAHSADIAWTCLEVAAGL